MFSMPLKELIVLQIIFEGTVYFMEWSHGLESWIGAIWSGVLEWILGVEPWSDVLKRKRNI